MNLNGSQINFDPYRFAYRCVQEAMAQSLPAFWRRRAETLESCRPKPGDFNGLATPQELADRGERLRLEALACQRHAQLLEDGLVEMDPVISDEIEEFIYGEAA